MEVFEIGFVGREDKKHCFKNGGWWIFRWVVTLNKGNDMCYSEGIVYVIVPTYFYCHLILNECRPCIFKWPQIYFMLIYKDSFYSLRRSKCSERTCSKKKYARFFSKKLFNISFSCLFIASWNITLLRQYRRNTRKGKYCQHKLPYYLEGKTYLRMI